MKIYICISVRLSVVRGVHVLVEECYRLEEQLIFAMDSVRTHQLGSTTAVVVVFVVRGFAVAEH